MGNKYQMTVNRDVLKRKDFVSFAGLAIMVFALAACQSRPETGNGSAAGPGQSGSGSCDTEPAQYIGQPLSAASIIPSEKYRVIRPGMPVTMDYRADRTNIEVDESEIITAVHCA